MPSPASRRAVCQVAGASSGPAVTSTRAPERRSSSARCRPGQAAVERCGDAGQLRGQRRGDQLGAVGRHQGDRVAAAHAELVQQVRVAVDVGEQLGEGAPQRLPPAGGVRQHGDRGAVRPAASRRGRAARRSTPAGRGPASGTASIAARSAGLGVAGPQQLFARRGGHRFGGHRAYLTTVRWVPRSIAPSSVATLASTTSPSFRYLGLRAWPRKKSFHLVAAGSSEATISTGFGGALSAVPTGVPVSSRSPGSSRWKRVSACSAWTGQVDHVGGGHVLPELAVDPQPQPQVGEPLELVGVQQHQRRPDRGERRVGLGLVELGLGQLHVAGGDVVGDHQAGDVVGEVVLGDRRADRHLAADHQPDLHLVVQQPHVARAGPRRRTGR